MTTLAAEPPETRTAPGTTEPPTATPLPDAADDEEPAMSQRPAAATGTTGAPPPARRRAGLVALDRALELLPLFRLGDSGEEQAVTCAVPGGGRWRVLPAPGDRLPGTFDQDVYVELLHRFGEAGLPGDGTVRFTLHAFLRTMGRKVDGRTYEQLRAALVRLERTTLEAHRAYRTPDGDGPTAFTLLAGVVVERRRGVDREQLPLFSDLQSAEPGDARATIAAPLRANLAAGRVSHLSIPLYRALGSPVARRLYRLLAAVGSAAAAEDVAAVPGTLAAADGVRRWTVPLETLADLLPLAQRYPSHRQRVLDPAHLVLVEAGIVARAEVGQQDREWMVEYDLPVEGG